MSSYRRDSVVEALEMGDPARIPWLEVGIDFKVVEGFLGHFSYYRSGFYEQNAYWDGKRDQVVASIAADIADIVNIIDLDAVPVLTVPPAGYCPKPMKYLGSDCYEDEKGNIYKFSSVTYGLDLVEQSNCDGAIPEVSDLKKRISEIEENFDKKPDPSTFELINRLVDRFKGERFIIVRADDVQIGSVGLTFEDRLLNTLLYPELTALTARIQGLTVAAMVKHYADAGVEGIVISEDYGSKVGPLVSIDHMNNVVFPNVRLICDEAKKYGLKVIKHSCGNNGALVGYFHDVGIDAYQSIQESADVDFKEVKDKYGANLCLIGGINVETLIYGSAHQVKEEVYRAERLLSRNGGFIFGSSQTLTNGCRTENIIAMKEAIEEVRARRLNQC